MDKILILDFGSQYTQLIAKRLRKLKVYCEIQSYYMYTFDSDVKGVILSGSPASVNDEKCLYTDLSIFDSIPILGICYGAQLIAHIYDCKISSIGKREYGKKELKTEIHNDNKLFQNDFLESQKNTVWMSHGDSITKLNNLIEPIVYSEDDILAGFKIKDKDIYGLQFHPEVTHTDYGNTLLTNFIDICGMEKNWFPENVFNIIENNIREIVESRENLNKKIIMAVSGGVDSTVSAYLINRIVGDRLSCVFVDNGLLRDNEVDEVIMNYTKMNLNGIYLNKSEMFISELENVVDPEEKRKTIGKLFIDTFVEQCSSMGLNANNCFLGQGTIYPDIVESAYISGSCKIKSHHNVGGLPEKIGFKLLEPLKYLFKDDVRELAKYCNLPKEIIHRHPFPGPGLAIRIIGEITKNKIQILQKADKIYTDYLKNNDLYDKIWQAGAILLPVQTVGVMGDSRTYQFVLALRAVTSVDGMTAECYKFDMEDLMKISTKIINEVDGINRVVYDVSSKPPATIEWE